MRFGTAPIGVNLGIFLTFCSDKYKHAALTGLGSLLENSAINIASLQD